MTEANPTNEGKSNLFRWFTGAIILLMIVLMVFSSQTLNQQGRHGHDVVVGSANGGDVQAQNVRYASDLIERLQQVHVVVQSPDPLEGRRLIPLLSACWGDAVLRDLKAEPAALFLALREARLVSPGVNPYAIGPLEPEKQSADQMGIFNSGQVDVDDLRPLPSSPFGQQRARQRGISFPVVIRVIQQGSGGGRIDDAPNALPPLQQQALYAALHDFFTIQAAASLPLNSVKPTAPMIDRFLAQNFQTFSLQLASIEVAPYLAKLPEPTDEQLRAHLAAHAATIPGGINVTNPFGFGYRVPDRVKIELISYRRADVRRIVEAEKTPYEWEVSARISYAKNPAAFAAPATQPTTAPTTAPASFEAVRDRAIAAAIDQATDQRASDIEKAIRSPMAVDYQMWANAVGVKPGATTTPATAPGGIAPKTSLDVTYDSPDYLRKLAAAVQSRYKVLPTVEQYTDRLRDRNELSLLGGFNTATRELPLDLALRSSRPDRFITGPEYAIGFTRDLLEPQMLEFLGGLVLERYRPSERLESRRGVDGAEREVFFFRVTEAQKHHPATDIEPIREQLKSDWRKTQAQELALAQANEIVASIKGGADFDAAATAAVPTATLLRTDVGPFAEPPPDASPLQLTVPAYAQFGQQLTTRLLGQDSTLAALDVPLAGRVFVTQRLDMRGSWGSDEQLRAMRQELRSAFGTSMRLPKSDTNPVGLIPEDLAATWLNPKHIYARLAWKPAHEEDAAK